MLLYPLEEEVEMFKTKYTDLQRAMNENKDNEVPFAESLERVAKMNCEDYIKCIRSSLNAPKIFLKREPNEMRICSMEKFYFPGKLTLTFRLFLNHMVVHRMLLDT